MNSLPDEFEQIAKKVNEGITDESLSGYALMTFEEYVPQILKADLPSDLHFKYIRKGAPESENRIHDKFCLEIVNDSGSGRFTVGTLDASRDEAFKELYAEFGWRTVIYTLANLQYKGIPTDKPIFQHTAANVLPLVIFSEKAHAVNAEEYRRILSKIILTSAAQLLRLGMTWYATRSFTFWQAVPGAVMIISRKNLYERNAESTEWFDLELNPDSVTPLNQFLPEKMYQWIQHTQENFPRTAGTERSETFWIKNRQGVKRRVEAILSPFNPFKFIETREGMSSGYSGVEVKDMDRQLYLLSLRDITALWEADKLQQEMEMARNMQKALLPSQLPVSDMFDMAAFCLPANNIGGDVYDAAELANGKLALILGDASGHGADSALLAAMVTGAFRAVVHEDPSPSNVLKAIDTALRKSSRPGFVTAAYLLFKVDGGILEYGLAGHYPPFIYRAKSGSVEHDIASSLPLGVDLRKTSVVRSERIYPGDIVSVFSDGILETRNVKNHMFETNIIPLIKQNAHKTAGDILNFLDQTLTKFRGAVDQEDDLTALIIKRQNRIGGRIS